MILPSAWDVGSPLSSQNGFEKGVLSCHLGNAQELWRARGVRAGRIVADRVQMGVSGILVTHLPSKGQSVKFMLSRMGIK